MSIIKKQILFLLAPIRVRKSEGDDCYEYFPFWFPLVANFILKENKWEIKCHKYFHDIYVPRKFMSPQGGENDYVIESESNFVFTTCEKYEENCTIAVDSRTSFNKYIEKVSTAFQKMTGQSMFSYAQREYGLTAEFRPLIHIEKLTDFTKKIRQIYRENLQQGDIPSLLRSLLIRSGSELLRSSIDLDSKETLDIARSHLGQMNNNFPLSRSQRKALLTWLKYESSEDIMVVNGPPGTGKTTLIQSLIASKIVQSAIKADKPLVALCCATTHKAVTNIIDSFNKSGVSDIRFLSDIAGCATYVSRKNELTKQYLHFDPNSVTEFRIGPLLPGNEGRGVDVEEYITKATSSFISKYNDSLSLNGIVNRLHNDVLYLSSRISQGLAALDDYLSRKNKATIKGWLSILKEDVARGRVRRSSMIDNEFNCDDENIEERFQELLDITYRYSAFIFSIRYWEARWLKEVNDNESPRDCEKDRAKVLCRKAMLTPCFVTTLHSSVSFLSYKDQSGDLFPLFSFADYLILDEAGQTLPEIGTVAFSFAQKAVVFGDEHQLEPIHCLHPKLDQGDLIQSKISLDEIQVYEDRKMLSSSGNMIGFAQSACNIVEDKSCPQRKGVMLIEHRRCRKDIIEYCNRLVYNGLLVPQTPEREKYLYSPFTFIPVDSESMLLSSSSRINEEEADSIVDWIVNEKQRILKEYEGKYNRIEDIIAIVTPFKGQENLLNSKLTAANIKTVQSLSMKNATNLDDVEENDLKPMVVGTVHKLQGAQAPIIIFSSVYGNNDNKMPFIDMKPNMLNVAVSRAQDAFIVFGNAGLYHQSVLKYYSTLLSNKTQRPIPSGLLKVFCNRFDRSTPYFFDSMLEYQVRTQESELLKMCTDGEMVVAELLDELQLKYFIHLPLLKVYEKQKNSVSNSALYVDELKFINNNSHYDFLIVIDGLLLAIEVDGCKHQRTSQTFRDKMKDSISRKLGVSLLRLPTSTNKSKNDIKHGIFNFIMSAITQSYSTKMKSWEITLAMYQDHFSLEDIAEARGVRLDTIKEHLTKAIMNKQLDAHNIFPDKKLDSIIHAVRTVFCPDMKKSDIYHALGGKLEYFEINIALFLLEEQNT